jgi:uncharacterized membrane protein YedE/YeeE
MTTGSLAATISRSPSYKSIFYAPGAEVIINMGPHVIVPTVATALFSIAFSRWRHRHTPPKTETAPVTKSQFMDGVTSFLSAAVFGVGLGVGGMLQRSRVQGFLDFMGTSGWDYSLAGVMGAGVLLEMGIIQWARATAFKVVFCPQEKEIKKIVNFGLVPANLKIDASLVVGAAMFGLGWGLTGYCPGPALVNVGRGSQSAAIYVPSLLVGMMMQDMFNRPAGCTPIISTKETQKAK